MELAVIFGAKGSEASPINGSKLIFTYTVHGIFSRTRNYKKKCGFATFDT
jgi:hypothetical protein